MGRLILVRHGAAAGVSGRCVGHADAPLSADGSRDIRELARTSLPNMVGSLTRGLRIVSSDLQRAADSAAIIAERFGASVEHDSGLREMNFGDWDGRSWKDIARTDPERSAAWALRWLDEPVPGGESTRDLMRRAEHWLERYRATCAATAGSTTIAVTHAGWIRATVTLLTNGDPARMFEIAVPLAGAVVLDVCAEAKNHPPGAR